MGEKLNPIQGAQEARGKIQKAVETSTSIKLELSSPIAACILGLPQEVFEKYGFSGLIQTKKDQPEVHFLVAGSQQIALAAFRAWQRDENPEIAAKFNQTQYLALYRLIQAINLGQANRLITGIEGLILKLLEVDDERLQGLSELIAKNKIIPDEDITTLHTILTQIWQNLPFEIQSSLASFSPKNVFNVS